MSVARSITGLTGNCATAVNKMSGLSEQLYSKSRDRASALYTWTLSRLTDSPLIVKVKERVCVLCCGVCV